MVGKRKKRILAVFIVFLFVLVSICFFLGYEVFQLKKEVSLMHSEISRMNGTLLVQDSENVINEYEECIDESIDFVAEADRNEDELDLGQIDQNSMIWSSDSNIRRVYLTFDDGPSSNTDKILDILNEYGVKATFFVVGKDGYTEKYQRIVEEGHSLGMHSFSHKYTEIYQSVESYQEDLIRLHSFLYEITGEDCRIVRFPGGSSNKTSKVNMRDLISYLTEQGLKYYDWNVSSGDASANYVSANQIANNVLKNVWKYDSVIVLMHDSSAKSTTVEALPIIIEQILKSEDTVLLPISEDTIPIQHIKQNVN